MAVTNPPLSLQGLVAVLRSLWASSGYGREQGGGAWEEEVTIAARVSAHWPGFTAGAATHPSQLNGAPIMVVH